MRLPGASGVLVVIKTEIDRRAGEAGLCQSVLLEVNIGGEPSKAGFFPSAVPGALATLDEMPNLSVRGLMAIPPPSPEPETVRPYFRRLRELGLEYIDKSHLIRELLDKPGTEVVLLEAGVDDLVPELVPDAVGRHALRIVQEALTNARKHAASAPVHLLVEGEPGRGLTIELRNPVPVTAGE